MNKVITKTRILAFPFCAVLLAIDQITKKLAIARLTEWEVTVIPHFLTLQLTYNKGIAFGIFNNDYVEDIQIVILIIVSATITLGIAIILLLAKNPSKTFILGCCLFIAGGLGNLIDRIQLSMVVDFIRFHLGNYWSFSIFNLADTMITFGTLLLIISIIKDK